MFVSWNVFPWLSPPTVTTDTGQFCESLTRACWGSFSWFVSEWPLFLPAKCDMNIFLCVWIVIWKLTMSYDFHNNYPRNRNYVLNSPWIWVYHYFVKIIIRLSSYRDWTFLASKHSFLLVTRFCRRFYHRTLIIFVISRTEETHSRFFGCSTR